jgi:hypothetical protein
VRERLRVCPDGEGGEVVGLGSGIGGGPMDGWTVGVGVGEREGGESVCKAGREGEEVDATVSRGW